MIVSRRSPSEKGTEVPVPRVRIGIPGTAFAFIAAVELFAMLVAACGLATVHARGVDVIGAAIVVVLAVGYQQLTSRARVLRRFLHMRGAASWSDQTSIWTCAAALLLPLGWASIVVLAVCSHTYLQTSRHRSVAWWRYAFSTAATLLAVDGTHLVGDAGAALPFHGGLVLALTVAAQLVTYTTISLTAITVARLLLAPDRSHTPLRRLLPSSQDLMLEGGALLLGLVLAQLAQHSVTLVVVVPLLALILQRACLVEELHAASRTDPKTGLLNANAWYDSAQAALRADPTATVLILDVDHFKTVNDVLGHLTGDRVLRLVADALRSQMRTSDIAGRFGGDEFVALLPNTTPTGAAALAERLREAIAHTPVGENTAATRVQVTVSIGLASAIATDTVVHDVLARADEDLRHAKATGRNRVHATPEPSSTRS